MKLKQLYTNIIKIHCDKRLTTKWLTTPLDEKFDWLTDGFNIWSIPKNDNPFEIKGDKLTASDFWFDEGSPVIKMVNSPDVENKNLIKLIAENGKYMYIIQDKLKFFDKNHKLKIGACIKDEPTSEEEKENQFKKNMCQIYENEELRGLLLGINLAEGTGF